MTGPRQRRRWHSLSGLVVLVLFAIFWGNIVLTKIAIVGGFTTPRFSARAEFVILLVTTLLGIAFLLAEERRKVGS